MRIIFRIIGTGVLLFAALMFFIASFLNGANFSGVEPTSSQRVTSNLTLMAGILCLACLWPLYRFTRKKQ